MHFSPACLLTRAVALSILASPFRAQADEYASWGQGDFPSNIGYTQLVETWGAHRVPDGAGVSFEIVEADSGYLLTTHPELDRLTVNNDPALLDRVSTHGTQVAIIALGSETGLARGVTEVYMSPVYISWIYDGGGQLNNGTDQPPDPSRAKIQNHSWNWFPTFDEYRDTTAMSRIDYIVNRDDTIVVVSTQNGAAEESWYYLSAAFNQIVVGQFQGEHGHTVAGDTFYGRPARPVPHLVAPGNTTSWATPVVSGAAAVLVGYARDRDFAHGDRSEVVKSLLMTGATIDMFPDWSRTPRLPIDNVYGAGLVNIYNSLRVLDAGPTAANTGRDVGVIGWSFDRVAHRKTNAYTFSVASGMKVRDFAATLVWNRQIDYEGDDTFTPRTLANLNLYLFAGPPTAGGSDWIDASIHRHANFEHLRQDSLGSGDYTLAVRSLTGSSRYALSWRGDLEVGSGTFTATLGGNSSLTKTGKGTFHLVGDHTYTGPTLVNNGSLIVNGALANSHVTVARGGLFGGNATLGGNLLVQRGGTLSPGNSPGTLNLANLTLSPGARTVLEIDGSAPGTQHDQILVTGNAVLDGTLDLVFGRGPVAADSLTLIRAGSYTLNGDPAEGFASIATNLGPTVDATFGFANGGADFVVSFTQGAFAPFALTANQRAVAASIDLAADAGLNPDLIGALNLLDASALPAGFDQVAPEEMISLLDVGQAQTRAAHGLLGQRFRDIRAHRAFSSDRFVPHTDSASFPRDGTSRHLGGFAYGQGVFADFETTARRTGVDFDSHGALVGADYRLAPRTTVGVYAGYQSTENGSASFADTHVARGGVYALQQLDSGGWLSATLGGAAHRFDTRREVLGGVSRGETDGRELTASLGGGRDFQRGPWTLDVEAGFALTQLWIDGLTESGGPAPLVIDDQHTFSARGTVGATLSYDVALASRGWLLSPYVNAGWQHEFADQDHALRASFASGAGGTFQVTQDGARRDTFVGGLGTRLITEADWMATIGYAVEVNPDYTIHQINGSIAWRF